MTDFRARCAELVELDQCEPGEYDDWREKWIAAIKRAKAALAQPEPQGPTDEELDLVVIAIQALTPHQPDVTTHDLDAIDRGRAILKERLACWGGSAPCPYVVSSDEGTSYCRLAEHTAGQLAKLLGEGGG